MLNCFIIFVKMSALSTIKEVLHKMKPELASKYHVSSIGLFGSVVRDDFTPNSDIDIIVDFSEPIGIAFIDLAELIEKRLNKTVDLVSKKGVKKKYFSEIEAEIIYV